MGQRQRLRKLPRFTASDGVDRFLPTVMSSQEEIVETTPLARLMFLIVRMEAFFDAVDSNRTITAEVVTPGVRGFQRSFIDIHPFFDDSRSKLEHGCRTRLAHGPQFSKA